MRYFCLAIAAEKIANFFGPRKTVLNIFFRHQGENLPLNFKQPFPTAFLLVPNKEFHEVFRLLNFRVFINKVSTFLASKPKNRTSASNWLWRHLTIPTKPMIPLRLSTWKAGLAFASGRQRGIWPKRPPKKAMNENGRRWLVLQGRAGFCVRLSIPNSKK